RCPGELRSVLHAARSRSASYQRYTVLLFSFSFFFFNDTSTTEIYTLSLHDALPILETRFQLADLAAFEAVRPIGFETDIQLVGRSEEHTSELQSRENLVCRLLLEKKKNATTSETIRECSNCPVSAMQQSAQRSRASP